MVDQGTMVRAGHAAWGGAPDLGAPPRSCAPMRLFCLVLHGVSPMTWPLFRPLLQQLDLLGGFRASLLLSPASQPGDSLESNRRFCAAMDGRLLRGDELVLNGFGPGPGDTPGQGASGPRATPPLDPERDALFRLRAGLRQFMNLDWPVDGFIAPGWQLSHAVRSALQTLPFQYTANRESLIDLGDGRLLPTPTAVGSDLGAPWRTALSTAQRTPAGARLDEAPCLRLAVHPTDLRHPDGLAFWLRVLDRILVKRRPSTLVDWVEQAAGAVAGDKPAENPNLGDP
jgi:predicted deacetylase